MLENTGDLTDQLLSSLMNIDRSAGMGVLAGGMIHAMNNYLGGITGHVDLMLLNKGDVTYKNDLASLESICDEAITFTRSLNVISNGFRDTGPVDLGKLLSGFTTFARRIFRSSRISVEDSKIDGFFFAEPGGLVTQAIFHQLMIGRNLLMASDISSKEMQFEVHCNKAGCIIGLALEGLQLDVNQLKVPEKIPLDPDQVEYHIWMIDLLCNQRGKWYPDIEKSRINLQWPTTVGPSGVIF